jgi:NAD(P)-dependent dehydrogenase (short-subunit alcohol dehydrogenase family)
MGKCIVITGAGSGFGRSLARRFSADGHAIALLGRNQAKLDAVVRELRGSSFAHICDVMNPGSIQTAFASIAKRHPKVDVLINNAAIYKPFFVEDATDDQINEAILTNFAGPIYCSRAVIPLMDTGGHIINISTEAVAMRHAMLSLYQSSKAGLERFSDALHAELEPAGVRVTNVRAGQMMDDDLRSPVDGAHARQYLEENRKRGLDFLSRPISRFENVAEVLSMLLHLPEDVNVPDITFEARHARPLA